MDAVSALSMTHRLYRRLIGRRPAFDQTEDYYMGKQPLAFATPEWRKANAARYSGFSDNWCRPVVDAEAERLKHTGLKLDSTQYGDAAKRLWDQWLVNEMDMQSSQGFVASLTTSRSYVIVWPDGNGEAQITWEHGSAVEIEYDWGNRRNRLAALKTWADDKYEYATLYTPTELWKFRRNRLATNDRDSQEKQGRIRNVGDGGWEPREIPGEIWPLPNPMGSVPVVEVPNRPLLGGDPVSEIAGVIPMQDAINLLWAYLFLSADYASMPARVVLGAAPPKIPILDDQGKKVGERVIQMDDLAQKRFMYLSDPDAKIDSWEASSLNKFAEVIDQAVGHISAQTRTPPTYLVTTKGIANVSAEGLKASEVGLVKKTLEFQTFATPAIREIYRLIARAMGDQGLEMAVRRATITWANPEIRSEAQLADALLKKKQMGYPLEYLMELDGLDPVEVERVVAMREAELTDPQITAAMRALGGANGAAGNGN